MKRLTQRGVCGAAWADEVGHDHSGGLASLAASQSCNGLSQWRPTEGVHAADRIVQGVGARESKTDLGIVGPEVWIPNGVSPPYHRWR